MIISMDFIEGASLDIILNNSTIKFTDLTFFK